MAVLHTHMNCALHRMSCLAAGDNTRRRHKLTTSTNLHFWVLGLHFWVLGGTIVAQHSRMFSSAAQHSRMFSSAAQHSRMFSSAAQHSRMFSSASHTITVCAVCSCWGCYKQDNFVERLSYLPYAIASFPLSPLSVCLCTCNVLMLPSSYPLCLCDFVDT